MSNGNNDWSVPFSQITWFDRLLNNHSNVQSVNRSKDIFFEITRKAQGDTLKVLCLREYTMGLTMVQRAQEEFGDLDIIYIGGGWNASTTDAKQYGIDNNIGIYVSDEMSGALWKDDFWNYFKKDRDGNKVSFIREE
ncbi:hypothetical protein ACU5DF_02255 [Aliivibrio wodanis]|uniref:Uncharacterized protein n=1 Tax=Photobacterium piscicola TaxID=1378299 RepID=A0A1T5HVQ9_9GAMM|nr:hypothetical protein [Photobacterium piscicola]SKC30813.1 hypothetical protein CZ809_00290 [Photobacterium piscicola]